MADPLELRSLSVDSVSAMAEIGFYAKIPDSPYGSTVRAFFKIAVDSNAPLADAEAAVRAEAKRLFRACADQL